MTRDARATGRRSAGAAGSERAAAAVIALPIPSGDEALVAALVAGHPLARGTLFDRHAPRVRRVLIRVLGLDQEVADLLHDVFLAALAAIDELDDPRKLGSWLTGIAVHHARALIRKRSRRRVLGFFAPDELERQVGPAASAGDYEAVRAVYRVLATLPADERIVFALRFVDGMDLYEVAEACRVSRATVSRRLQRAEDAFLRAARQHEALAEWLEKGSRWSR